MKKIKLFPRLVMVQITHAEILAAHAAGNEVPTVTEYEVIQLVNDAGYEIGQKLSQQEVDGLCDLDTWTVTIDKKLK